MYTCSDQKIVKSTSECDLLERLPVLIVCVIVQHYAARSSAQPCAAPRIAIVTHPPVPGIL